MTQNLLLPQTPRKKNVGLSPCLNPVSKDWLTKVYLVSYIIGGTWHSIRQLIPWIVRLIFSTRKSCN